MKNNEEIRRLNLIIKTKESERKEWADMCIKKQQEIERLKSLIEKELKYYFWELTIVSSTCEETENKWQMFKITNNL